MAQYWNDNNAEAKKILTKFLTFSSNNPDASEAKKVLAGKVAGGKLLELRPPLAQGLGCKLGLSLLQQIEREKKYRS